MNELGHMQAWIHVKSAVWHAGERTQSLQPLTCKHRYLSLIPVSQVKSKTIRTWWCVPLFPAVGRQRKGPLGVISVSKSKVGSDWGWKPRVDLWPEHVCGIHTLALEHSNVHIQLCAWTTVQKCVTHTHSSVVKSNHWLNVYYMTLLSRM